MARLYCIVEGRSEKNFIKEILSPLLAKKTLGSTK